ncbi:MAG: hypothetical protein AAFU60_07900, partial [Bacteroidota bacterium]
VIRGTGELFARTFTLYRLWGGRLASIGLLLSILFALAAFGLSQTSASDLFTFEQRRFGTLLALPQFFLNENARWLPLIHVLLFTGMVMAVQSRVQQLTGNTVKWTILTWLKTAIPLSILCLILAYFKWFTVLPILLYLPFLLLWAMVMDQEQIAAPKGFSRTWALLSGQFARMTGLALALLLISLLVFVLMDTVVIYFLFEFIGMNLALESDAMDRIASILLTITTYFLISQLISVQAIGTFLLYFTLLEIQEAPFLAKQAQQIGLQKRIRGIAKES